MKRIDYDYLGPELHLLGRHFVNSEKKANMFTFSASGFEVEFIGTRLIAHMIATECGKPAGEAGVSVIIDDAPFNKGIRVTLDKPEADYILVEGLPYGRHVVKMMKRTESACSLTGWKYLETDGEFTEITHKKALKMEFYGDSITAGNGDEGVVGDTDFQTRTENAAVSYGALTAEKLDADFSIIAIGGYPAYRSPWVDAAGIKTTPELFSLADCHWGTTKDNQVAWDNSQFVPDIVVINLGTNDIQWVLSRPKDEQKQEAEHFKKAMKDFVATIDKAYGRPEIIMISGMMLYPDMDVLVKEIAAELNGRVHYLYIDSLKVGGFTANGGHPNGMMHAYAADKLADYIQKEIIRR